MKHKRILGIPILAVIAVVTALACVGGGVALGQWAFNQSNGATVVVKGSGLQVFKDAGLTQTLAPSDILAFGDVRAGTPTATVHIYAKNIGTDPVRLKIHETGLNAALTLSDAVYGNINSTDVPLYTPASWTFTPNGNTTTLNTAIGATDTSMVLTLTAGLVSTSTGARIDTETVTWPPGTPDNNPVPITRGQGGTTAAAHSAGALVTFGSLSGTAEVPLAPGAVRDIQLKITATGDVSGLLGQTIGSWSIVLSGSSDY